MEEVLAFFSLITCGSLFSLRIKLWWHTRHLKNHSKSCPHTHENCL
jgi:hypothetical protein